MKELADKVAVVTGGGSGIGAALALAAARAGMDVAIVDIDGDRAEKSAAAVAELGRKALASVTDVTDGDAVEQLASKVYETLGACHLLCNNAGVSPLGFTWEHSLSDWNWVFSINLFGVVNGIRSFVPRMLAQGSEGHVVNTVSAAALRLVPANGLYAASKYAVLGLTETLRDELAPHNIGVSALCPGAVQTNIGEAEQRRPGGPASPEQMAKHIGALTTGVDRTHVTPLPPERVANLVLEAVRANEPYIITHPGSRDAVARRHETILNAYDIARTRGPDLP